MEYLKNIEKKIAPYLIGISILSGVATTAYADSPAKKARQWIWRGPGLSLVELFVTPLEAIGKHGLSGRALKEGTLGALANAGSRLTAATLDATVCSLDETPLYSRDGQIIKVGEDSSLKRNIINQISNPLGAD